MAETTEELRIDPVKVRLWLAVLAVLFGLSLLWLVPKYVSWLRLEYARTSAQIEQIR